MTERCGFDKAWIGPCQNPVPCEEHSDLKCVSCGEKATHTCDETGQFVCGENLCDDCMHVTFPDGTNGGVGFNMQPLPKDIPQRHMKKSELIYKPWWMRDREKNQEE